MRTLSNQRRGKGWQQQARPMGIVQQSGGRVKRKSKWFGFIDIVALYYTLLCKMKWLDFLA